VAEATAEVKIKKIQRSRVHVWSHCRHTHAPLWSTSRPITVYQCM